jgi:hypothetical protein
MVASLGDCAGKPVLRGSDRVQSIGVAGAVIFFVRKGSGNVAAEIIISSTQVA